jgi:hypothetical protein
VRGSRRRSRAADEGEQRRQQEQHHRHGELRRQLADRLLEARALAVLEQLRERISGSCTAPP